MVSKKIEDGYLVVLKKGEDVVKKLTAFCIQEKIQAGFINGIGAAKGAVVGYYHLPSKTYKHKRFNKFMEIAALNGNVSLKDGKPYLHLHVVLSDNKLRAFGGHLKEATVGGTCEVHLITATVKLERTPDKDTGLALLG